MRDMQDVFRAMLDSIGATYPHVRLMPITERGSMLILPLQDRDRMDITVVCGILQEAVKGAIGIGIHEHKHWEFRYNPETSFDVPLQFLKIFEIYWGLPTLSPNLWKRLQLWCRK